MNPAREETDVLQMVECMPNRVEPLGKVSRSDLFGITQAIGKYFVAVSSDAATT
jgi:hypothetical protein